MDEEATSLSTEDESSESSSNEWLVSPGKLNLDSSFFKLQTSPSSSRVKDDESSESDGDFTPDCDIDSAALLAEVMKNLENAKKTEEIEKSNAALSVERESPRKKTGNTLSDEIASLLLQGESGASAAYPATGDENVRDSTDVEPPSERAVPKEGIVVSLPGTGMAMFGRRKKRDQDFEEMLKKKMNQRLRSNQIFVHKVGLLCWLAYGFRLNREINDCLVLSTSLSLVPKSSYPKGRTDLKYLEGFTKWFKNLFKLEPEGVTEGLGKDTLLARLDERKVHDYRELVLLYAATLRSIGLNCRLVVSLSPPVLKLPNSQLFQNPKERQTESGKNVISKPKKESAKKRADKDAAAAACKVKARTVENVVKIVPANSGESENKSKLDAKKRAADVLSKYANDTRSSKLIKTRGGKMEERKLTAAPAKNNDDAKSPPRTRQLRSQVVPQNSQTSAVGKTERRVTFANEKGGAMKSPIKRTRAKRVAVSTSAKLDSDSTEESKTLSPAKKKRSSENVETIAVTSSSGSSSSDSEDELETVPATKPKGSSSGNSKKIQVSEARSETESEEERRADSVKKKNIDRSKRSNDTKLSTRKNANSCKNMKNNAAVDSDSDKDFEPRAPVRRKKKDEIEKKESGAKSARRRRSLDRRVLSSDEEPAESVDVKGARNIWVEVYVESEESWIGVSVLDDKIHCTSEIYKKASKPVLYVIAWNSMSTVKDVTRRYCPHWLTVTRKQRIDENWWNETLNPWKEKNTAISRAEDEMLLQRELEQPLPKTVGECKGHPLYALARHLLKFEALYPPECVPLGHLKTGEAIYSRHCVHTLCSRETWIKKARVVKPAQEPYKIVKAMPKYDKLSGTVMKDLPLELFGKWQTSQYIPPVAKDGIVPRNEYGNVDLFKECMLPVGTVHINLPALYRVARKLNIDCVPAVVGFNFGARGAVPATEGYVVCAEFEETLREAWHADQIEAAKRAREKREKRIYGNWRKLIRGLFVRERLAARYDFNQRDSDDDEHTGSSKPSTSTELASKPKIPRANVRKAKKS